MGGNVPVVCQANKAAMICNLPAVLALAISTEEPLSCRRNCLAHFEPVFLYTLIKTEVSGWLLKTTDTSRILA